MTVQTQIKKVTANGNDSATVFSFSPLVIFASTDLVVTHVAADGTETVLTEGTGASNYSVTVALYPGTGSITYPADEVTPLPTGQSIVMKRVLTLEQQVNLEIQGGYNPEVQEKALDKLTMMVLQQEELTDRTLKVPISSSLADLQLPDASADLLLGWNAAETGLENKTPNTDTYITIPVPVAEGGTGSITAETARAALGVPKYKLDATTAPLATNDSTESYGINSIWVDVTNDRAYVCVDATATAAVWLEIGETVGLDGQHRSSDGTDPVWKSGAWVTLADESVGTGATIDFELGFDAGFEHEFILHGVYPDVADTLLVRVKEASAYVAGATAYRQQYLRAGNATVTAASSQGTSMPGSSFSLDAAVGEAAWGKLLFSDAAEVLQTRCLTTVACATGSGATALQFANAGSEREAAAACEGVRFLWSGGNNFAGGRITHRRRRTA